jgi:hypothetical protein
MCPYRENGMCELDISNVLREAIGYLKESNNITQ